MLNLSKIFKDQLNKAFVNVDSSFRYVHDLEDHIQRIFHIKQRIDLTIDAFLLPSNESIKVIHTDDLIMYFVNRINRFETTTVYIFSVNAVNANDSK